MTARCVGIGLLLALASCTFDRSGAGTGDLLAARPERRSGEVLTLDQRVEPGRDGVGRDGARDAARDATRDARRDTARDAGRDTARDSTADKAKTVDTMADSIPVSKPFGAPTAITQLNTSSSEDDPSLTGDLLEICFDSNRAGGLGQGDIWCATRTSATGAWGTPQPATPLNTATAETTPEISSDGLTIFVSSNRAGGQGSYDIYVATRATRTSAWSTPQVVSALSSPSSDNAATPSSDLLFLVLASDRAGGVGSSDLYSSTRASTSATWATPTGIATLNTTAAEGDPTLNPARTVIYFSSDRAGGQGNWDIWRATRPTATGTFGTPTPVTELNTSSSDGDAWLSPDGSLIVFASDRGGNWDLYQATR